MGLAVLILPGCAMGPNRTTEAGSPNDAPADPYFAKWGGWELRHLEKAQKKGEPVFQSDFGPRGLERDWKADGVAAASREGAVVLSLSPESKAAGARDGILWARERFSQPLMIEVAFTLDPDSPHDANLVWGQNAPSKKNLGKDQECYVVGYFGWGGKSCGFERASDWHVYGITGACDPKPGTRRTGVWIIDGKTQCLYLDGQLVLFSYTPGSPPADGHFGLAIYQSTVTFHSVRIYRLGPTK